MNEKKNMEDINKKQKKLLLQLEKEISKLEYEINHSKISNLKIHMLRALKKSLCTGRLIAPYVLTAYISFQAFSTLGITPFVEDEVTKRLEVKKEIDNLGNISYEEQYGKFDNPIGTISYVGKWNKKVDGFYEREVKTYATGNIEEIIVTKLINDEDITSLDEILGDAISSKKQTRNNLTKEEIEKEPYLQAVIYSEIDDDYIVVKETIEQNMGWTILWFLLTTLIEFFPVYLQQEIVSFDYGQSIQNINKKYPLIEKETLMKKLEIKRDNYNRLTR